MQVVRDRGNDIRTVLTTAAASLASPAVDGEQKLTQNLPCRRGAHIQIQRCQDHTAATADLSERQRRPVDGDEVVHGNPSTVVEWPRHNGHRHGQPGLRVLKFSLAT